ncbi:MAG: hypothetical protein HY855_16800 [Burkholderiales bacterium]|nr:hypothetical protein [Burkholderiales bacterium]
MVAAIPNEEVKMNLPHWKTLATALAAAALATTAAPALAAEHAHETAAPHKLALDHGRKWATDAPLREGMNRIRGLVAPRLGAAHTGKLPAAQYQDLATQVEAEVGKIVATCKLEPQADAMLHGVIAELGAGTDAMRGKNPQLPPAQGLVKLAQAVNAYGGHFDHPGFKPIRNIH